MTDYKKLGTIHSASNVRAKQVSLEERYWKKLKKPVIIKDFSPVVALDVSKNSFDIASAVGTRIQIISSNTHELKKTISRFKDVVHCVNYRQDGKLLAAGDNTGLIQIFDVASRSILRSLSREGNISPIRACKFLADKTSLATAYDDGFVAAWDVTTQQVVQGYEEHQDYVRSAATSLSNPSLFCTGSYDQTVKLWDSRTESSTMTFKHQQAVESVLIYPNDQILLSSAGNQIYVWDILSGRLIHSFSSHQKTVTCLGFNSTFSRVISGGLDQFVKIYDARDYSVVHSFKYPSPVLTAQLSSDDSFLAAGLVSGILSIRQKETKDKLTDSDDLLLQTRINRFHKERAEKNLNPDVIKIARVKMPKMTDFDKFLRKFQYKAAIDCAFNGDYQPTQVCNLLLELRNRESLISALAGRDENGVVPIIQFLSKYLVIPKYSSILIETAVIVLDLYEGILGQSVIVDECFKKLKNRISVEIELQKQLCSVKGLLELTLS